MCNRKFWFPLKKKKKRLGQNGEQVLLQEEEDLNEEEEFLSMELLDIFADVTTPDESEESDNEPHLESNNNAERLRRNLIHATEFPERNVSFASLYQMDRYRKKVKRKMTRLRNVARRSEVENILKTKRFQKEVERIHLLYTDSGNRPELFRLVALYCVYTNEDSETDTESEDDNDDITIPHKKEEDDEEDKPDKGAFALKQLSPAILAQ
jgi:hypothetical protein